MNTLRRTWTNLTTPRATDPDEARQEYMTRLVAIMMSATLIPTTLIIVAGVVVDLFTPESIGRILLIALPVALAAWLACSGHWRPAAALLPATLFVHGLYALHDTGFISGLVLHILAILLTGMLSGVRAQAGVALLALAAYVIFGLLEPPWPPDLMAVTLTLAAICFTGMALLQWLFISQLHSALAQARNLAAELARSNAFLTALSQVATRIETTSAPDQVLATLGSELRSLNILCFLALFDDDRQELIGRYVSFDPATVTQIEECVGIAVHQFRIPAGIWPVAPVVGEPGQPLFAPDLLATAASLLPDLSPAALKETFRLAGINPDINVVYLPLKAEERVLGIMVVWGANLREQDVPPLSVLSNQVAVALENARLMEDLETSLQTLRQTQSQLVHAQKMEAVGRLAGGVAHDFNNLLTIVELSARLLGKQLHARDPLWEQVREIQEASARGTRLTQQLLSFSRREIVGSEVLDLNRVIQELSRMLQRLLGEDVEMRTILADDLWLIKVDPAQLDQVIVNLAANARDAMPHGGSLTIRTANVCLDDRARALEPEVPPGEYVALTVADTGVGMDELVQAHLFEPFFTTKERGQGTGLGLPAVYGIVRQNGGAIELESKVGQGTRLVIYLPRTTEPAAPARSAPKARKPAPAGAETILIVEDESAVLRLARQILEEQGYRVLAAGSGPEALRISQEHQGPIDLLLTDLIMPQMNGRELAEQLQKWQPGMLVLYMSGYSDDVLAFHAVPGQSIPFLAKPFSLDTLTQRVRALLDGR